MRQFHGIEHARSLEDTFFWGPRSLTSTNLRTCGGLTEFISTNITALTTMTQAQWETFLRTGFRYGSQEKVAFCSPKAAQVLNTYAQGNIRVVNDTGNIKYGVNMTQYISAQGIVNIVMHRNWADSTIYGGYCVLVDMDAVRMRPLRATRLDQDVQAPDYDGFKDRYLTEVSLEVQHERKHALLTGLTGA